MADWAMLKMLVEVEAVSIIRHFQGSLSPALCHACPALEGAVEPLADFPPLNALLACYEYLYVFGARYLDTYTPLSRRQPRAS